MSPTSFLLVLSAAVLHAVWNAVMKAGDDRLLANWAIVAVAGLVNIPVVAVVGLPHREVWWVLGVTVFLHASYNLLLVAAYERVDLSVAYPIARGTAPVVATLAGITLLGDDMTVVGVAGVLLVTGGLVVAATGRPLAHTQWAVATGLMIAAYTVVDGYGVRENGDAVSYIGASFVLHGAVLTAVATARRSVGQMRRTLAAQPVRLVFAGGANAGAYLLVMIAARVEPLGLVSGLRETSTLFGLLIAHRFLHERVTTRQTVAIAVAAAGAVVIAVA